MVEQNYRYDAFLSYTTAADYPLARDLRKQGKRAKVDEAERAREKANRPEPGIKVTSL